MGNGNTDEIVVVSKNVSVPSTIDDDSGAVAVGLGSTVVVCCADVVKAILESEALGDVLDDAGCSEPKSTLVLDTSLTSVDETPSRGLVVV